MCFGVRDHEHRAALRELAERHFFDGLADEVVHQRAVLHDLAVADVDAVMGVAEPGSDQMRAERRSFTRFQRVDARSGPQYFA